MKTQTSSHKKIPYFILFSFFLFSFSNTLISQTPLSKYPTSLGGSNLKQYDLGGGISRFGIGLQTNPLEIPSAVFHIKDFISIDLPVFRIDGKNGNESVIGSVQFLTSDGASTNYGIKQIGDATFYNYFQSPMGIGAPATRNYMLNVGGPALIKNGLCLGDNFQLDFPFVKFVASLDFIHIGLEKDLQETTIMRLTGTSVIVNGKVKTNTFQMETGAGTAKVLVSDQYGNGTWGDVSSIYNDEDWYFNDNFDLYANPRSRKVGILTAHPSEALEVCHRDIIGGEAIGGIAINQLNTDSIIKKNEIKFKRNGTEEWALGSYYDPDRDMQNSFFIWNNILHETAFFISENGMAGVGTSWPRARLDINGSFKAARMGISTDPPPTGSNWKLLVEGGIKAREIKVTITDFPDYVFGKDYALMKISELDRFVKANHRLPGLPSAAEIEGNGGVDVGAMQTKLLEKVEEQALYIISLQQQIDELKAMILSVKEAK